MEREEWHLDKRVPIATLVTIAVLAAGGLWHVADIRTQQEVLSTKIRTLDERINRETQAQVATVIRIENRLDRMDEKLDRLIEAKR